jgi:hypothetical protein
MRGMLQRNIARGPNIGCLMRCEKIEIGGPRPDAGDGGKPLE